MKYGIYFYTFFVYTVLALLIGKMPFLYINMEYHSTAADYIQVIFFVALALIFLIPHIFVKYSKQPPIAQSKMIRILWGIGFCILMGLVAIETYFHSSAASSQAKEFWLIYTLGEVAVLNFVFCVLASSLLKNVKFGDSTETFQEILGKPEKIKELEDDCIEYTYSTGLCASFDSKRNCYAIKYIPESDYYKILINKKTGRIGKFLNRLKSNNRTELRLFIFAFVILGFVFLMLFASRPEIVEQHSKAGSKCNSVILLNDCKTKLGNEKQEFIINAVEPIKLKIDEIPLSLRKYYKQERLAIGFTNYASQYTISKDNKSLLLRVYCHSQKIRYIKIISNHENKDLALEVKKYLTKKYPEILTSM